MLSKILARSALGGELWIKDMAGPKPLNQCPRTCVRCVLLGLAACLTPPCDAYQRLANFLRVSNSVELVNSYFLPPVKLCRLFAVWRNLRSCSPQCRIVTDAQCQNILYDREVVEHLAQGCFTSSDLGLEFGWPRRLQPQSNAWTALRYSPAFRLSGTGYEAVFLISSPGGHTSCCKRLPATSQEYQSCSGDASAAVNLLWKVPEGCCGGSVLESHCSHGRGPISSSNWFLG